VPVFFDVHGERFEIKTDADQDHQKAVPKKVRQSKI
jgi:hypothetical protein